MDVLNKLVRKNLVMNKQRTVVSIIGIILSCALITALLGLVTSFTSSMIKMSIENYGNRHVTLYDVPSEELEKIGQHKNVESYYKVSNDISTTKEGKTIGINYIDKDGLSDLENSLIEGKAPKNENEIVLDYYYADENFLSVGDKIQVKADGSSEAKEFIVTGLAKQLVFLGMQSDYNFYTYTDKKADNYNMHILYTEPETYEKTTDEIQSFSGAGGYEYEYNEELLKWSGYMAGSEIKTAIYSMGVILAFIIVATSVFCIRNSFAISVNEKIKMYGMLSSIGATPKQIKRNVLKEGMYLGIIGIPLGILIGMIVPYFLVEIINSSITSFGASIEQYFELFYSVSIPGILISILLSVVTIYFSSIGSARRASKVSEIEAIKNQEEIKIKSKKLNAPKVIEKLFNVGGVIAYKNMKRNRSKYRTTIISLIVSIATFVSISYFVIIGFNSAEDAFKEVKFSIVVSLDTDKTADEEVRIYEEVSQLNFIESSSIHKSKEGTLEEEYFHKGVTEAAKEEAGKVYFMNVGNEEYERFLEDAGLKVEEVDGRGILVNNEYSVIDTDGTSRQQEIIGEDETEIMALGVNSGEKIKLDIIRSDKLPMGGENFYTENSPVVIVSDDIYNDIEEINIPVSLYLDSDNERELMKEIAAYEEENGVSFFTFNISEYIEGQEKMVMLIAIFMYGFISVIILIGMTNIFNTITTNMKLRAREFAILRSIGVTKKEFNNMIRLESAFYGIKSLFFGLTIGVLLSYLMYKALVNAAAMNTETLATFEVPWIPILISIVFVFLIVNLIMKYSMHIINKQNIIETIKNENI